MLKKILKNDSFYAFAFIFYSSLLSFKSILVAKKLKLKKLDIKSLKINKNIYILGSGPSSLLVNDKLIDHERDTSIGFNFWIYHDYVPDFYFFEIKESNLYLWYLFCNLLEIKKDEYKNTIFIIKDLENLKVNSAEHLKKIPVSLKNNFYSCTDFHLGRGSNNRFDLTFNIYNKLWFLHNFYPKCRGSISLCLSFAKALSPMNIIIAGVDLSDSTFHLARDFISTKYKLPKMNENTKELVKNTRGKGFSHSSEDGLGGEPIISYVIKTFANNFKKHNIKTFTLDNESKLTDFLDVWDHK